MPSNPIVQKLLQQLKEAQTDAERNEIQNVIDETKSRLGIGSRGGSRKPSKKAKKESSSAAVVSKAVRENTRETITASEIQRTRVSASESVTEVKREMCPDGTELIHQVTHTITSEHEFESKIKVEITKSLEVFYERKIKEQHQWTQTLTDPKHWNQLCSSLQEKYSPQNKGVFQFCDEPLTICLKKHEAQLVAIVSSIQAEKPADVTLASKIDWLRKAYYTIGKWYPQTASAFFRCYGVFNGAQLVLQSDAQDLAKYEKSKAAGTLPTVCVPFSRLSEPGVYTRKAPFYKDVPIAPPFPRTTMTETQLLCIKNAYDLYCSNESFVNPKGPMHSLRGEEQITKMSGFVDDFLQGETSQFFNHIMSMQIAWRVVNGQSVGELRNVTLLKTDGVKNDHLEMQDKSAVRVPFYRPDEENIRLGWVRVMADFEDWGRYELILPDFVGIKLFGTAVQRWHKESFCPAITAFVAKQPNPGELPSVMLDKDLYPRSLLDSEPEFANFRRLEARELAAERAAKLAAERAQAEVLETVEQQTRELNNVR